MTAQETLREKSQELNRLTAELATLKTAALSAREQLREAQEGLQEFDGLSSEVTKWRASQVKAGSDPRKLPDGLQKKQGAKEKAAEELSLAQGTLETIVDDLAFTQRRLEEIKGELRESGIRALEAHAESIADDLLRIKFRAEELTLMLEGLQQLSYPRGGYTYSAGETDKIQTALLATGRKYPPLVDPVAAMKARWETKLQAIILNPDVSLDDLKPVLPGDYKS